MRNGLVPVFCDVKEDDYTIDVSKIENLITDQTVAIVRYMYTEICVMWKELIESLKSTV